MFDFPDQYEQQEQARWKRYERLPVCTICGQKIQDETYIKIFGYCICRECLESDCTVDNDVIINGYK